MAAPFVSGLAALAIREAPNLSGYQIKNVVVNSSTYITGLVPRTTSGSRGHGLNTVVNSKTEVNTLSSQPSYVAVAPAGYRAPASETAPKAGCGLVSTSVLQQSWSGKGPGSGSSGMAGLLVVLSLLPIVVWQVLRTRALESPKNRRRFERFVMNSEIKVRVGDRELVGQMNTISMGGASFKADAMLERGGIVTLQIASPDGSEQVNVEGRVVWNEQNQSYGVQFAESTESARDSIKGWTKGLAKVS